MSTPKRQLPSALGIGDEHLANQAKTALERAHHDGLLSYRQTIDTDNAGDIVTLRRYFGDDDDQITDESGHFYLTLIKINGKPTPLLIAEHDVLPFVYALYLALLPEKAHHVAYRKGMLRQL